MKKYISYEDGFTGNELVNDYFEKIIKHLIKEYGNAMSNLLILNEDPNVLYSFALSMAQSVMISSVANTHNAFGIPVKDRLASIKKINACTEKNYKKILETLDDN